MVSPARERDLPVDRLPPAAASSIEVLRFEGSRLLRFSALTVGEIAFRTGFGDPLYFAQAFKRHYGEAPVAYGARIRGAAERMGAVT